MQPEIKEFLPEKLAAGLVAEPYRQASKELGTTRESVLQTEDSVSKKYNENQQQQNLERQINRPAVPKNIEDQRINHSTSAEHLEEVLKSTYPTYTPAEIPSESLAPLELPFSN